MTTITIEVPDELSELIARAGEHLPELLARCLRQPVLPAHVYRYVLDFMASSPSPTEVAAFGPSPEMAERLRMLLAHESAGDITPAERDELDEYERLEHLMVLIKSGRLRHLTGDL